MSAAERRQQVTDVAAGLFDEGGYASTTMDDIAREVGVAKPTLYHYFPSKHDILAAIHGEFIDLLISRHEARTGAGLRPEQLLLEAMADILELMETHRGHVRVFFEHHRELPAEARGPIRAKRETYRTVIENLIGEGIEQGVLRQTDRQLAALAAFGMCNWAYQWFRPGGPLRSREIAYQFWSYLIYGLGTDQLGPLPYSRATPED